MPKLAAGIIGAGSIGNYHLMGYAAYPKDVTIQAICDITPTRLAEMGEKYKVPEEHRYRSYKDMLNSEKLDLISICVPNALHFECASAAMNKGIHTLIEKPLVLKKEDARELKKIAARKGVKNMIAFSHRFMGMNIAAKKLLDRGVLGKPFMIRVRFAHGGPYPGWAQSDWFYKKRIAGGGAMLDMGIHAIDLCQYFIGPIKSVSSRVATLRKKIEVDDNAVMIFDFAPEKCLGYIEVGWTSGPGFSGIEVYGDKGTFVLDYVNGPKFIRGVTRPDGTVETAIDPLEVPEMPASWQFQMECWIKFVKDKKPGTTIPGLEEGLSSLAVALAAEESNRTGKRVTIK